MKNWALLAVAVVASGSMVIGSAACTVGSDSGDAAGSGGSAGSAAGGSAGSTAGGSAGAAGATGGAGGAAGTVITDYFSDPSAKECADCLGTMTGKLTLEPTVDCGMVVSKCGSTGCDPTMGCIEKQLTDQMYTLSNDCAVIDCMGVISTNTEGEDFVNCAAEKCGTKCGFTVGFVTKPCKLSRQGASRGASRGAPFVFCRCRRSVRRAPADRSLDLPAPTRCRMTARALGTSELPSEGRAGGPVAPQRRPAPLYSFSTFFRRFASANMSTFVKTYVAFCCGTLDASSPSLSIAGSS